MNKISATYRLFFSFLLGLMFLSTAQSMAQVNGYSYRKKITIQASQVQGNFTDFPILINRPDADLKTNVQNTNGYDIIFTSDASGNNVLDHEIESYNASTGRLIAWVKVPNLEGSSDTPIYMFYGNSNINSNPSVQSTWSSQYTSVYHFQNSLLDATSTGNNGANQGSTDLAAGQISSARQFNGTDAYVQLSQNLAVVLYGNGTVSAWIKTMQTGPDNLIYHQPGLTGVETSGVNDIFYGHINPSGEFGVTAGAGNSAYSTTALNNDQWHYVVFTRDASSGQVWTYVDGSLETTVTSETGDKTTPFYSIGRIEDTNGSPEYYKGAIDEFRVSDQIFDADVIRTSYNNQKNPSQFYTMGAQKGVGFAISGTVFEDITGDGLDDGDNTLSDASGDQQARANVKVLLFRDGGDGQPDGADDNFITSTTTDANGGYSFSTSSGTYWVAVDSRTGDLTDGTTWAEQTYGSTASYCSDGAGGTALTTGAGPCFGGRRGSQSDNLPAAPTGVNLSDAEHLIKAVVSASDVTDNDVGFSFNVVSSARDGDDDGGAARSIQGGLRQFIQNANAIAGANAMRFVPAVSVNQSSWWQVALSSVLPAITGANTTIDGTAYQASDGITVRDLNSGNSGHGGSTVGVGSDGVAASGDEPILPEYPRPELEINGNDYGAVLNLSANNSTVSHLSIYYANNSPGIQSSGTDNIITKNYLGLRASGAGDPGNNLELNQGVSVEDGTATINSNRVGFTKEQGILFDINASGTVTENEITNIGLLKNTSGDAIGFQQNSAPSTIISNNRIEQSSAYGIESFGSSGNFSIANNSIINTGQGSTAEQGGIRLYGSDSVIEYNLITGAKTSGIAVVDGKDNKISKNSIYGNGSLGIDLVQINATPGTPKQDGITPNNGSTDNTLQNMDMDYPVFTDVTINGSTLHLEGYVGTAASAISGTHTIELFKADDDGNNAGEIEVGDGQNVPHGEGKIYLQRFSTASDGTFDTDVTLSSGTAAGDFITATATDTDDNTSEFSANKEVTRVPFVSGTVFEDITGDGLNDGDNTLNEATGDQQARANVKVLLFRDGGDGQPDGSDDSFISSTTTDANGGYSFSAGSGTYWVAADSRTGALTDGTTWPEQTYGAAGSYCSDGAGGTAARSSAGPCFGGRRGDQSDNLPAAPNGSSLANAEHLIKAVVSSSDITGNNFGFSYNAVTSVRDGDDDSGAARSVQGGLRQFIQNANAIAGANAMRFVPAVAANQGTGTQSWWQIRLQTGQSLPVITGQNTTLDGTAYNYQDGTSIIINNQGTLSKFNVSVGVDEGEIIGAGNNQLKTAGFTFDKKELEILDNGDLYTSLIRSGADDLTVQNMSLFNTRNRGAIKVRQGSINVMNNFIGKRADGSTGPNKNGSGIMVAFNSSSGKITIQGNYIASIKRNGLDIQDGTIINITNNYIESTGEVDNYADGIGITFNADYESINIGKNFITNSHAFGIDTYRTNTTSPKPFVIQNNTIQNSGLASSGGEDAGMRIQTGNSTIIYNKILSSRAQGILVSNGAQNVKMWKNIFTDNGTISIDLLSGDDAGAANVRPNTGTANDLSANGGQDYPVFAKVIKRDDGTVRLKGYVGTPTSKYSPSTLDVVELYKTSNTGGSGEIIQGDGASRPHGEGNTFLASVDIQSNDFDSGNSFSIVIPTNELQSNIAISDYVTATITNKNGGTSEFSANYEVQPPAGGASGIVYSDANHNGAKESSENGISGVTVVLNNIAKGTCQSIQTSGNGYYEFTEIADGDYKIFESANETTPTSSACPSVEEDPANYVSTTPNTLSISVTGAPITEKNFGDFNGSKLTGTVFKDDGTGGGTANDGIQNGDEVGIANTQLKLTDSPGNTLYAQTKTKGDGSYTLWIADAQAASSVRVAENNFGNNISTGGQAGTTGGSYDRPTDVVSFTPASGIIYNGVNFGDVPANSFNTDGEQNTTAGTTVFFPHTFTAHSDGEVSFTTTSTPNPSAPGWNQLVYEDTNCNGKIDSGEQLLDSPSSLTKGQNVCIVVRSGVPAGIPDGSSNTITVQADFSYSNASPALSRSYARTDLVKVTNATGSGLKISKQVDQAEALPGETLIYTITYTNNSSEPLNDLKVIDTTPAYTNFTSASYQTPLPDDLTNCIIDAPSAGQPGTITWAFDGTLVPGSSGSVSYEVTIEN